MLEGFKKFIKQISESDSININISQTEVTVNGKKVEGEVGAKIIHGVKDVFVGVEKVLDKVEDAMDEAGKVFEKVEDVAKTANKERK
jgi:hypothetical protein